MKNGKKKIVQTGDISAHNKGAFGCFAHARSAHLHNLPGKSAAKIGQNLRKQDTHIENEVLTKKITVNT
ncbi:MAG: hypothetical protein DYG98_11755 [Haliscomenobacteraceae bacterium CHB4]|nr:hypothetical protein [Haliscomenobacteraceae bacterium CHB4]